MVGINILGQAIKCLILNSQSITTIIFIQPLLMERLTIKLIKISFYLRSGTGSGFRKPLYVLYKALARQQIQQLEIYLHIILYMFSQQYSRQSSSRVFLQPRQPATGRSYTCLRSLSLSLLQLGITYYGRLKYDVTTTWRRVGESQLVDTGTVQDGSGGTM